jgi:hypothetical protein
MQYIPHFSLRYKHFPDTGLGHLWTAAMRHSLTPVTTAVAINGLLLKLGAQRRVIAVPGKPFVLRSHGGD